MRSLAIVAAVAMPAIASPCPVTGLDARVMTPAGAVIEDGGGLIVSAVSGVGVYDPKRDPLRPASWHLMGTDPRATATIETIAPGLVVYRLPAGTGAVSLLGGTRTLLTVRRSADRDASLLAAPMPTSIDWSRDLGFRDIHEDRIVVHLIGAAPRGAVAMVAYGEDGTPRSWGEVQPNAADVVVFASPGRCQFLPEGVVESQPGQRISVAWLDASGRRSARSALVEVVKRRGL